MAEGKFCCPLHFVAGAFSPDRTRAQSDPTIERPSLVDYTPKKPSRLCVVQPELTAGLYEKLDRSETLLLKGAQVITMRGREVLRNHDVLVQDGRIVALRPTGTPEAPGMRVIDAHGCTVMPGLSDIHAHLFTAAWAEAFAPIFSCSETAEEYVLPYELALFVLLANGITRVEILAGCPDALWMRDAIASGAVVGPRMVVGSPLVDGNPSLHSPLVSYQISDRKGGLQVADMIAELGYDFAKPYSTLTRDAFRGLITGCERHGIRLMGHVPSAVGAEAAIRAGQQGIAHVSELFCLGTLADGFDSEGLNRIIELMAEKQVWLQATITVLDRVEAVCGTRQLSAPDRQHMNPLHLAMWGDRSPMLVTAARPERRARYEGSYRFGCEATRRAHEAGVRILTGTDCPNPYVVEGFSLHEELERLVRDCDLDSHDVLYASTRQARCYHGEDLASGTIQEGASADIVCVQGDPLKDIRQSRSMKAVVVGHTLLTQTGIDAGIARMHAHYREMPAVTFRSSPGDCEKPLGVAEQ